MEGTERKLAPIRGIAFDLEGTIVNLEALHHTAHLKAAADVEVNLSWQEALERLPHFVGGPDEEVAAEIASQANKRVPVKDILLAKQMYFEELLQQHADISPREGFLEFVKWAKTLGLKVAIGTVTNGIQAKRLLQRAGLLQVFSDGLIVVREDVSAPKPHPDVYYETAHRIDILPENQLVFEDSVVGLRSARSAGCRLAAVPTIHIPGFVESLYREGAESVFKTWNDPDIQPFVLRSIGV